MPNCYNMYGYSVATGRRTFEVKVCADTVFYRPIPNHPQNGVNLIAVTNGVETVVNGTGWVYWRTTSDQAGLEQLPNSECLNCVPSIKKYDCINGECQDSLLYNTPGLYGTMEECLSNCCNDSDSDSQCPQGSDCVIIEDTETLKNLLG